MKKSNQFNCCKYKKSIKSKLLALFDSKCCKCGFNDQRALQIDHINRADLKKGNYRRGGTGLYISILNREVPRKDYQLLCANCNWIKRFENKEHTIKKESLMVPWHFPVVWYTYNQISEIRVGKAGESWAKGGSVVNGHMM